MKCQGSSYSAHNCSASSLLGMDVETGRKSNTTFRQKPTYKSDNPGKIQYHIQQEYCYGTGCSGITSLGSHVPLGLPGLFGRPLS